MVKIKETTILKLKTWYAKSVQHWYIWDFITKKLHEFFDRFGLPVADVQTGMKDAVEAAYKLAKKGETVLLSPCCASFDLFKSYEDRGDQFKECVRAL